MNGARGRAAAVLAAALLAAAPGCERGEFAHDPRRAVPDAEVPALLAAFASEDAAAVEAAAARVEAAGDRRFVAVLIELVAAGQLGVAGRAGYNRRVVTLERLSEQRFGGDWLAWAEWYGGTALVAPPGFAGFKGSLFAAFDPAYGRLLADGLPTRVRVEGIHWGGVPVDGIPALDAPAFVAADAADFLTPGEPVVGLELGGEARAYPLRILDWHELVNDRFGEVPVALAYCTLCGSAVAYDARGPEGRALRFWTSGLLYQSNKLMLDRETQTLWSQLTGRPVLGPLAAHEELALGVFPSVVATWEDWRARHPDTRVLSPETGFPRAYQPGNPYGGYFASPQKLFPVFERRRELPSKERVYGLVQDGTARAFTLEALVRAGVLNDAVGELPLVLVATEGRIEVEGESGAAGFVRYDAGAAVRGYRRDGHEFRAGPDAETLVDAGGRPWRVTEAALVGPEGARAPRVAGTLSYWFAWQSFHPRTTVWGTPEPAPEPPADAGAS